MIRYAVKEISPGVFELASCRDRIVAHREPFHGTEEQLVRAIFKCKLAGFEVELA